MSGHGRCSHSGRRIRVTQISQYLSVRKDWLDRLDCGLSITPSLRSGTDPNKPLALHITPRIQAFTRLRIASACSLAQLGAYC